MFLLIACTGIDPYVGETRHSTNCYVDADLDGHGDATPAACGPATSPFSDDCDDSSPQRSPSAPETCNGEDDDCDTLVDDADPDRVDGLPFWVDADGDGFGGSDVAVACTVASGLTVVGGDCDDGDVEIHPGASEACDGVDRNCDGVGPSAMGSAAACPAESCTAILAVYPGATDGPWWLRLPSGTVQPQWCDMLGGGWTLGFLRNTASTGSQGDFGLGEVDVAQLQTSPAAASDSSQPILSWMDLNQFPYTELRLAASARGAETWSSAIIPRSALRLSFGDNGYYLYGDAGYYWCGGDASYTDAGIGAVNNPPDAPLDCKGHGSLGSGWDFSDSPGVNAGLTLCGGDASSFLAANYGYDWIYYGTAGGAQAIWLR